MAGEHDVPAQAADGEADAPRRRRWRAVLGTAALLLLAALLFAWVSRERIAGNIISGQLETLNLPATYEIESIGATRQVLRNVVVGDPRRPDLTIERVEAVIEPRWGIPAIGGLRLVRPRLYGSYRAGKLSFGSLDPVIFAKGDGPFRLPDLDLTVIDGRGLIGGDLGATGIKLEGKGNLRGGFSGIVAAVAPRLTFQDCEASRASLYGKLGITGERPSFAGPVRLTKLDCSASGLRTADVGLSLDMRFDRAMDGVEGKARLASGAAAWGDQRIRSGEGTASFTYRKRALTARYALNASDVDAPQVRAAGISLTGQFRSSAGLARIEADGELGGEGLRLGNALDGALASAQRASAETLAAPLLARMRAALARETRDSRLSASYLLRRTERAFNLVVPQAALRGGSGGTLASVSRFQLMRDGAGPPRLAGNFFTGGDGLPRIAGRMERLPGERLTMRLTMPDYRSGTASIAVPTLTLVQLADGAMGFSGEARLSGALPGGRAENLVLPLSGNWSDRAGLSVWRNCATLRFDRLSIASLTIDRRSLLLCPPRGSAIVRSDGAGTRFAAGASSLNLSGRLGETPIRIRGGAIGVAVPGVLAARGLDIALGPPATASRFTVARLDARIGSEANGRFSGSDVRLSAVPLDVLGASGDWRLAGGKLSLAKVGFRLEDRQVDDRFQPLTAHGATLTLNGNDIAVDALLREPASDRPVVRALIHHDLASANGHADLRVDDLQFDEAIQPDTLTRLALGVIANARGALRGTGRIDWTAERVTSRGRFTTDSLDFAAAFGPVKGASGSIEFTDLLGLVTAPGQKLRIASINPGIEVNDGILTYALHPDSVLEVNGAQWPFFDGTLALLPTRMTFGASEQRRFTLRIAGLNAARFVERLELANISATGTFDGTMPLVFDQDGGRIEGGSLRSRPPGGNVSYVGALTYEDLSAMANFAFDALKSLDYSQMDIAMDGTLEGEIVTRLSFGGVTQGEGAKRNFLTDRIGKLPIQFNVNLRAPFFQLISSFKSFYDPEYVRDPRTLGLMDAQGRPVPRPPAALPASAVKPPIQP